MRGEDSRKRNNITCVLSSFVQWTLGKASSVENSEEVKVLFMSALAKVRQRVDR